MGGPRLTPEQIETASKVFAETNNTRAAADAIGVNESTLRTAFARLRTARNRDLHAQACERGLRKARAQVTRVSGMLERFLKTDSTAIEALGMEPGDIAKLVQAFNGTIAQRLAIADREERRKQSKLTREKTRAEVELLRKKINGEHVDRVAFEGVSDDELERRIAERVRSEAADKSPTD